MVHVQSTGLGTGICVKWLFVIRFRQKNILVMKDGGLSKKNKQSQLTVLIFNKGQCIS